MRKQVEDFILSLQDQIVSTLEKLDPNAPAFRRDSWVRPGDGGYGRSYVFACPGANESTTSFYEPQTTILEKAGVNISIVRGHLPPAAMRQMRADHNTIPLPDDLPGGLPYSAQGLSLVIHPRNPHAPTVHANYRYFEITEPLKEGSVDSPKLIAWWFGGGSDLTPSYLYEEDAIHFHSTYQQASAPHGSELFPAFKKWCDEYFYITHRQESRGIGGIFFDDLHDGPHERIPSGDSPRTADGIFHLVKDLGAAFLPSYIPILERRHSLAYTPKERRWQLLRRGRYVEFNLVYDRGTKFGLMKLESRVESILISLPEEARWEYRSDIADDPDSEEGKLQAILQKPREWV